MSRKENPAVLTPAIESPSQHPSVQGATYVPPQKEEPKPKSDKNMFWPMLGTGAMLVACGLGVVLYFQITQSMGAVRTDISSLRQSYIELLPRSEFSKHHNSVDGRIQTFQTRNATALEIWTSRVSSLESSIERMRRETKATVDSLDRELQQLRERIAVLESRPKPKATQPTP